MSGSSKSDSEISDSASSLSSKSSSSSYFFLDTWTEFRVNEVLYRVSHPYSFDTDPDPAFRLNTDLDPIRIQDFYDQKLKKKNLQLKIKFVLDRKLQFTYP